MGIRDHVARLYPEVRAYALALSHGDRAEADDLAGDAVMRALSHPGAPLCEAHLRFWLLRVVRNLHVDRWRAGRVRREHREAVVRAIEEGRAATAEDDALGRLALGRLSADHREVLILVDMLGHSYAEAAAVVGVPCGTVMSRLACARAAMMTQVHGAPGARGTRGEG